MASSGLFTYQDLLDHLSNFLGGDPTSDALRDCRAAIQLAMLEVANAHAWTVFYDRGRISTVAPQNTGTVDFDFTGGTYERMLTLTGATWPAWVELGLIVLNQVPYEVDSLKSSGVLTLTPLSNPGADVTASTYTLLRDRYPLPADLIAIDRLVDLSSSTDPQFVHPRTWLQYSQTLTFQPGTPRYYSVMGDADYLGDRTLRFAPAPALAYNYDFVYRRRPRPLLVDKYTEGTVSVTAGSATVTGVGTTWLSKHVGSTLRLGADAAIEPTGLMGISPYAAERTVMTVDSATSITVDANFADTFSGVRYVLSDPVDIEAGIMLECLVRCTEKQLATSRRMKTLGDAVKLYQEALERAKAADAVSMNRRIGGGFGQPYARLQGRHGADVG